MTRCTRLCPNRHSCHALPKANLLVVCLCFGFDKCLSNDLPDVPCRKKYTATSKRQSNGQQPSTKALPVLLTCRIQNPDIQLARRDGAHGGLAGRGRAGLGANRTVRPGNKPGLYPPKHRKHVSSSPQKHEQAKPYVNRWRKKPEINRG